MPRIIKLTGEALKIGVRMKEIDDDRQLRLRELEAEFGARQREIIERSMIELNESLSSLELLLGMPIEDVYDINVQFYQDHGDIYLVPTGATPSQEIHPLREVGHLLSRISDICENQARWEESDD